MSIMKATPRVDTHFPGDAIYRVDTISGLGGDLDLRTLGAGYPRHSPQRTLLVGGAAASDAVFTTETGATITINVPANAVIEISTPIATLVQASSGEVQTIHMWWTGSGAIQ